MLAVEALATNGNANVSIEDDDGLANNLNFGAVALTGVITSINGGAGHDTITGGAGDDVLNGNRGLNVFVYGRGRR